jgi:hypothetical protein
LHDDKVRFEDSGPDGKQSFAAAGSLWRRWHLDHATDPAYIALHYFRGRFAEPCNNHNRGHAAIHRDRFWVRQYQPGGYVGSLCAVDQHAESGHNVFKRFLHDTLPRARHPDSGGNQHGRQDQERQRHGDAFATGKNSRSFSHC